MKFKRSISKPISLTAFWLICIIFLPKVSLADIIWSADHETGNLLQWTEPGLYGSRGGSYDSGNCARPTKGVTSEQMYSGNNSMKMTITSWDSGCRQFRHAESTSGNSFYYSAWLYLPKYYSISGWTNLIQFKSKTKTRNDAVWVLELANRDKGGMYLMLRWKGLMEGPTKGAGTSIKYYHQTVMDVPVGKWFHVELYLKQSSEYAGRLTVWQDGVQIYDMNDVKTKYPTGDNRWSINAYGAGISPMPFKVYVDDAVVSTSRLGPKPPKHNDSFPRPPANLRIFLP